MTDDRLDGLLQSILGFGILITLGLRCAEEHKTGGTRGTHPTPS